jgi:hypothetical protein
MLLKLPTSNKLFFLICSAYLVPGLCCSDKVCKTDATHFEERSKFSRDLVAEFVGRDA